MDGNPCWSEFITPISILLQIEINAPNIMLDNIYFSTCILCNQTSFIQFFCCSVSERNSKIIAAALQGLQYQVMSIDSNRNIDFSPHLWVKTWTRWNFEAAHCTSQWISGVTRPLAIRIYVSHHETSIHVISVESNVYGAAVHFT